MSNNPDGWSALDSYLDEIVCYRAYPVTRSDAFLIEDELYPENLERQLWVGRLFPNEEAAEYAMPYSHARAMIFSDLQRYHRFANINSAL